MSQFERAVCRSVPWRAFTRRVVLPWALQRTPLRGDVLEIGAGSGAMAEELLASTHAVTMCVTDVDPAMVATASARLARFGTRVATRQADATALPFPDATFDAVLSWIMLHHTIEWETALREALRVLRPGGLLLGYDLVSAGPMRWIHPPSDAEHRPVGIDELRVVLSGLPVVDVAVRPGRGRVVMRFTARKAATPDA
jgi:ubiquinone/menaquinone biosynthesis C-methylase UbiE